MNVTIRQLRYVKSAALCGSIAQAAEQLPISQSSISAAIDRVEQEFGVQIFVRQPSKGLMPTQSGRQLLTKITALLGEVDHFAAEATGLKTRLRGELNIGCFAALSPHVLPDILRDLTRKYPDILVHLHEGHLRQVQDFLLDGSVDIILSYDLVLSDRVSVEVLGRAPPYVVLPKGDPLARKKVIDLNELRDKPMILLDVPESRTYFELLFKSINARPKIVHRTETYEMVRGLVAAGLGFSLLNLRPLIDKTYNGLEVICRPLANDVLVPQFVIGKRRHEITTPLVEVFSDSCRQYFKSPKVARHTVSLP